jgi:hypothetical protein
LDFFFFFFFLELAAIAAGDMLEVPLAGVVEEVVWGPLELALSSSPPIHMCML